MAIYSRSPAAFRAVRSLGILQLPCSKEIRQIIGKNADGPGINEVYLQKQSNLFKQFCKETMNVGKREPLGVGALIWVETKVGSIVIVLNFTVHAIKLIIAIIPCPIDTYLQCIIFNSHLFWGLIIITQSQFTINYLTIQMYKNSIFNLGTIKDCVEFHEFQNHWVCHEP